MQSRDAIRPGALEWADSYPPTLEGRLSAAVSLGAEALELFTSAETPQDELEREETAVTRKQRSLHYGAVLMGCFMLVLREAAAAEASGKRAGYKEGLKSLLDSALDSADSEERPPARRLALSLNHVGRAFGAFFERQSGQTQPRGMAFEAELLRALGEASAAVAHLRGVQAPEAP